MRVADLDREMPDVIPTGVSRDSQYLFARMTDSSLDACMAGPGRRVLDVASGFGQDTARLAESGALCVGAEPSERMSGWARTSHSGGPLWVRSWADPLPFAGGTFDAVLCKGALDHFDAPEQAISEMSRVAKADGRVVLAVANFESLACRLGRAVDGIRVKRPVGRASYDVPADHFTRYDYGLLREQAAPHLHIESLRGVSLGWGFAAYVAWLERRARRTAAAVLEVGDRIATRVPSLADVFLLVGRPRRSRSSR